MISNIGLMDYDTLFRRAYVAPNYDLGVTYAMLKEDKNLNVRLITSLSPSNLREYDKIYIFKIDSFLPHPSGVIDNYYSYPIEEFGPGFLDRPLRPKLLETRFLTPDFTCYNGMLIFSMQYPKYRISWKIKPGARGKNYQPIRLYEKLDDEDLRKDFPTQRYCTIYDDPTELFNNPEKYAYLEDLTKRQKRTLLFVQRVDISLLRDTNILERIITDKSYVGLWQRMVASSINDNVKWLMKKAGSGELKRRCKVEVKMPVDKSPKACLLTLLELNLWNHKAKFKALLYPSYIGNYLAKSDFALLAFKYVLKGARYMSYYEYVFNQTYLRQGVPMSLLRQGERQYEEVFRRYGMSPGIKVVEEWVRRNPQYEEHIFIGGKSKYEEQRRKYYGLSRSKIAFTTSTNDFSDERST